MYYFVILSRAILCTSRVLGVAGSTTAFQAERVGSIPTGRSNSAPPPKLTPGPSDGLRADQIWPPGHSSGRYMRPFASHEASFIPRHTMLEAQKLLLKSYWDSIVLLTYISTYNLRQMTRYL